MATINQEIDVETMAILAEDFDVKFISKKKWMKAAFEDGGRNGCSGEFG